MDRIHKLPFMTGGFMAVLTGIVSYACGSDNRATYIRMAVVMVVFYIVGIYIRNTITSIYTEKEEKERERLREEEEAAAAAQQGAAQQAGGQGQRVNLVAGDPVEEFTPLTVGQVISSKVKE